MQIQDIANQIYLELNEPSDNSIPSIAYWLRSNIGRLNTLIFTSFSVNPSTYEVADADGNEIGIRESDILKKLYSIHEYGIRIKQNLNALNTDSILEVSDDGSSVKRTNKNEVSKTIASVRRQEQEELDNLVYKYCYGESSPAQVAGSDTVEGRFVSANGRNSRNFY